MVAGVGDVGASVVTLCSCGVHQRVGGSCRDSVVRGVDPDFIGVQDVIAVIPACRPGEDPAEHWIVDSHIRERNVACVGDIERVRDLLADQG